MVNAIEIRDLRFTYRGGTRPAVDGVHFSVKTNEIFGFLGPSGAGKSTTQNILVRLLDGYVGEVTVLGRRLSAWDRSYYRRIGIAFESPNHYLKLTARENLQLFASLFGTVTENPDALLELVGLAADGDKRIAEYSKGMRGRLSLARALLHQPDLLFLDEPTAGLDPGSARRVRDIIRSAKARGATVFLTTHDMVTADELCDRVAFLVDGRIAAVDEPRALKRQHGRRDVRVEIARDGRRLWRDFPVDELFANGAFEAWLRSGSIETIHTMETTLEGVFAQLTGRTLT